MSWSDFTGVAYTRDAFVKRMDSLNWTGSFQPKGIILHNTAAPTLAQWAESGAAHDARLQNLKSYYQGLGWHAGPHWFVSRDFINEFMKPTVTGVHSPSYNSTHFGIEMVGDYSKEAFNSGDGAKVRDNAIFLMAYLCRRFGWNPAGVIKLHKEDPKTTHDCPGKLVVKSDIIQRVSAAMGQIDSGGTTPDDGLKWQLGIKASYFGGGSESSGTTAYGLTVNGDTRIGAALPYRFTSPPPMLKVRSCKTGLVVDVPVIDRGPWMLTDPYWETGARPIAETSTIIPSGPNAGRRSNGAGIDVTPATLKALGLSTKDGIYLVDWAFAESSADPVTPTPTPEPETTVVGRGDYTDAVRLAQKLLGFSEADQDGDFGKNTELAVELFQRRNGLEPDRVIGPKTWEKLLDAAAL